MATDPLEHLSEFGRLAVKLDQTFSELSRLSGQMERLDIESDSGLEVAIKILNQFAQNAGTVGEDIQEFSKSLQEARGRSEAAAKQVSERAPLILQRKEQQMLLQDKLDQVERQVQTANAKLAELNKPGKKDYTDAEKEALKAGLEHFTSDLAKFIADVQAVKEEAARSRFKIIERQAGSIIDTLQSSRRKLEGAIAAR